MSRQFFFLNYRKISGSTTPQRNHYTIDRLLHKTKHIIKAFHANKIYIKLIKNMPKNIASTSNSKDTFTFSFLLCGREIDQNEKKKPKSNFIVN